MKTVGFSLAFEESKTNYWRRKRRERDIGKRAWHWSLSMLFNIVAMEGLRINKSSLLSQLQNQLHGAFLDCPAVPPSCCPAKSESEAETGGSSWKKGSVLN